MTADAINAALAEPERHFVWSDLLRGEFPLTDLLAEHAQQVAERVRAETLEQAARAADASAFRHRDKANALARRAAKIAKAGDPLGHYALIERGSHELTAAAEEAAALAAAIRALAQEPR